MDESVLVEHVGRIAVVRLNRPRAMNAIDHSIRHRLGPALRSLNASNETDAIVLTGAGERAFCAGQDLQEAVALTPSTVAGWLNHLHATYQALRDLDKPIVAALNGVAFGAGFQMALMCDLRIAHPGVRLGQPEVRAGLASIVGSYLMSLQIGQSLNQQMSLTAEPIGAERAQALGLINELVPDCEVVERAVTRAREMADLPRTAMRVTKQRFRERTQAGFEEACNAGIRYQLECYSSGEATTIMEAFLRRRQRGPQAGTGG
ncbi:MAG: enoyl-CoA hydratase/isomerase family protein [Rhizobiaceae bacterium]|nr:enoyl-CoA hydratase/isomerase family protein [Rhizobiaceae bacterium]